MAVSKIDCDFEELSFTLTNVYDSGVIRSYRYGRVVEIVMQNVNFSQTGTNLVLATGLPPSQSVGWTAIIPWDKDISHIFQMAVDETGQLKINCLHTNDLIHASLTYIT